MIQDQQKQKLDKFLEAVNLVSHSEGAEKAFDLGLIIFEKGSQTEIKDIAEQFQRVKVEVLEYGQETFWEEFVKKAVEAMEAEKWILLNIQIDPDHPLINMLKNLSEKNSIQLLDFRDKEIFNLRLPLKSRVICAVERDFLEKKISDPHFLNIFGPVTSL